MKFKPKEILVNLPIVLMFDDEDDMAKFASNINTLIHGKVHLKYEELGKLNEQFVGIFYLQRNNEYSDLRQKFMTMIEEEEVRQYGTPPPISEEPKTDRFSITKEEIQDIKYIIDSIRATPEDVFMLTESHRTRSDTNEYRIYIDRLNAAYDESGTAGVLAETANIEDELGI